MSDVRGVGLDLCEIARMEKLLDRPAFLKKVLTEKEQEYIASRGKMAAESMAAMWAAKEACLKAFGTGITVPLTEVEVLHDEGRPYYSLHGKAQEMLGNGQLFLSISHEAGMAAAFCIWTL